MTGSPAYTIVKDSNQTVAETITGADLTSATITWALLPLDADFSGDLDTLITTSALFTKTVGSGITLTDPGNGVMEVALDPGDSNTLAESFYWVLIRCTLAGGDVLPLKQYLVALGAEEPSVVHIVTLGVIKPYLRLSVNLTADDEMLAQLREGAEDWIQQYCGCHLTEASRIEYLDGGGVSLWPGNRPIVSVTEVYDMDDAEAEGTDDYNVRGNQIIRDGETRWADGRKRWRSTTVGGYGGTYAVPAAIKTACLMLIKRAYDNRDGAKSEGSEGYSVVWDALMESDIVEKLRPYRLEVVA